MNLMIEIKYLKQKIIKMKTTITKLRTGNSSIQALYNNCRYYSNYMCCD
jgi:hypothetical protein